MASLSGRVNVAPSNVLPINDLFLEAKWSRPVLFVEPACQVLRRSILLALPIFVEANIVGGHFGQKLTPQL